MSFKIIYGFLIFFILAISIKQHEASKILGIFPLLSKSHTILGSALLKELARRGHEVTMLSGFEMDDIPENYTEIIMNTMTEKGEAIKKQYSDPNESVFKKIRILIDGVANHFHTLHENANLTKFLDRNEKFDLCINMIGITDSFLGICHRVNATIIGFNNVGMNMYLSTLTYTPTPYSYVPHIMLPVNDEMSFFHRVANTLSWTLSDILLNFINTPIQKHLYNRFYPNGPSFEDIKESMDLILANSNYATDTLVPLPPNIIPIGGFHLEEKVHISRDLQTFLDTSKHGVIYFNLGTNAKGAFIKPKILNEIISAFTKLPYDILWKYEEDMPNKPRNVRLEKWLPQRPILAHPNIKVFMTHAGNGGLLETIHGGVPMICLPHFGDQLKNCATSVANGYAVKLDITKLTEDLLLKTINEVIENSKYKDAIMLKSDIFRNQAVSPMDRAVFWVEHVIRHKGAKHLKTGASKLSWFQRNLLDVFLFYIVLSAIIFGIIYLWTKMCIKYILRKFPKIQKLQ